MMKTSALAFLFLVSMISASEGARGMDLNALQSKSARELNALYTTLQPGPIPAGSTQGKALFFSGTAVGYPTSLLASLIWQGKVFEPKGEEEAILLNRVFGFQAIRAQVFYGRSLYDEKEAIIIDYHDTSLLFSSIRDEIREVQPGLYLGKAYIRTWVGAVAALFFGLRV